MGQANTLSLPPEETTQAAGGSQAQQWLDSSASLDSAATAESLEPPSLHWNRRRRRRRQPEQQSEPPPERQLERRPGQQPEWQLGQRPEGLVPVAPCKYVRFFHEQCCSAEECNPLCCLTPVDAVNMLPEADATSRRPGSETLLSDPRFAGDFIGVDSGNPRTDSEQWPSYNNVAMKALGDVPAVPPPVTPSAATARAQAYSQAHAETLQSAPFSDYNAVLPAEARPRDPAKAPDPAVSPVAGQPHTVFNDTCDIFWHEGGDWIRAYIARHAGHHTVHNVGGGAGAQEEAGKRSKRNRFVRWSSTELYAQVLLWFTTAQSDKRAFYEARSASEAAAIRPRARTFIIPDRCHRGGGDFVWDLRPLLQAMARGEEFSHIRIDHVDDSANISPALNAEALQARMTAAGVEDEYGMQQLLELGLMSQSKAPRHTILQANYPAVAKHAHQAAEIVTKEAEAGILSAPLGGIPLFPVRLNPFNAIEREGKDPRFCCDMSSPQAEADGGGRDSLNAGIPWEDTELIAEMRLTSSRSFARDVGILQSNSGLAVWIATADWTAYYRNLAAPVSEYWGQLLWLHPDGPQLDFFTCFGDAAAPAQSNRCQDIFLHLIEHEFSSRLQQLRADGPDAFAGIDQWVDSRMELICAAHPDRCSPEGQAHRANQIWLARQRRMAVIHGFFDDSLLGSVVFEVTTDPSDGLTRATGPYEALVASVLVVAEDIGLPVAAHKLDCGTNDGRTGRMDLDKWLLTGQVWWKLRAGSMKALGKEIDLQSQRVRDTEQRVTELKSLVAQLCTSANNSVRQGRPTVSTDELRTVVGKAMYVVQTEPHLRGALNLPLRSLKLVEAVAPLRESNARHSRSFQRRDRQGQPIMASFNYAYFDKPAQVALSEMAAGATQRIGVPFNPARPTLGSNPDREVVYILQDASGSEGGGGGALYLDPAEAPPPAPLPRTLSELVEAHSEEVSQPLPAPAWSYDGFSPEEQRQHSTYQEGLNANRNLQRAISAGFSDVIEVLDNQSWVFCARSGASSKPELQQLLAERRSILAEQEHVCVYTIWQPREHGWLADAISKLRLPYSEPLPLSQQTTAGVSGQPKCLRSGEEWAREALTRLGFGPAGLLADDTRLH